MNDGGCELDREELKNVLRDISLNYIRIEKNTGRAHAGNVGIGSAKGSYIGFLDDDDEFYPEHIKVLVTFLDSSIYRAAYTDVEMITKVYSSDKTEPSVLNRAVFSRDFSYPELLVCNYIPFNSILFHKDAIKATGCLDEEFELYEDWDFLIRTAERFPFYHIKQITAVYNQWNSELQINQRDSEYMREMHLKIISKYHEKISPEFIFGIWQESQKKDIVIIERDAAIAQKDAAIAGKDAYILGLETVLKDKDVYIGNLDAHARNLEAALKNKDIYIESLKTYTKNLEIHTKNLEAVLKDKNIYIESIEAHARNLETHKMNLESMLRDRDVTLENIYNSGGWRMLLLFYKLKDWILPHNTKRRYFADRLYAGMRKQNR